MWEYLIMNSWKGLCESLVFDDAGSEDKVTYDSLIKKELSPALNKLGRIGWELVSVDTSSIDGARTLFFKRQRLD